MRPGRWIVLLVACCCWALAFAQEMPPPVDLEDGLGTVKGTVKFDDGTPYAEVLVEVTAGGTDFRFLTNDQGLFAGALPAGEAVVTVGKVGAKTTITAGKEATVDVVVKRTGVLLMVSKPDKTPVQVDISAACQAAGGDTDELIAVRTAPGQYWFPDVPATASAFAAILRLSDGYAPTEVRQQWNFPKQESLRTLALTINTGRDVAVKVLDGAGKPVANATMKGTLTSTVLRYQNLWEPKAMTTVQTKAAIRDAKTDADGLLSLGTLPVGTYTLTLAAGDRAGAETPFEIKPDGTVTLAQYPLGLTMRSVSQVVFGANGKPAANAVVYASYAWAGQGKIVRATADGAGKVTWQNLPPTRVIVWGSTVPAGVLSAAATNVTAPLPAPVNEGWQLYKIQLTNLGDTPTTLVGAITGPESSDALNIEYDPQNSPDRAGYIWHCNAQSGVATNVMVMAKTNPPRVAYLSDVYLPLVDDEEMVLSLPMQEAAVLTGRFMTKGQPVTGVSHLEVVPAKLSEPLPNLPEDLARTLPFMQPREQVDGSFTVLLPAPGTYRLLVDLYDQTVPATPELLLQVKSGVQEAVINLPEPLLSVAPGTKVHWLTMNAPTRERTMTVAAQATSMPIFGDREHLLALWYRPTPDKLVFWNGLDPQQARSLPLRSVFLTVKDGGPEAPVSGDLRLAPMLPVVVPEGANTRESRATSECTATTVPAGTNTRVDLWPGQYVVTPSSGRFPANTLEIPADGDAVVTIPAPAAAGQKTRALMTLVFPPMDYGKVLSRAAQGVGFFFDGAGPSTLVDVQSLVAMDEIPVQVPAGAKSMTLQWLGVGVMKQVALPANAENAGPVKLPTWENGVAVSGKVLTADGKPYAGSPLLVGSSLADPTMTVQVQTDAQGQFSVQGVLPGTLFVFVEQDPIGGWTLNVPAQGLTNVSLQMTTPVRFSLALGMGSQQVATWWIPDSGKPMPLPVRIGECSSFDMLRGGGWLWACDEGRGDAIYLRMTAQSGWNNSPATPEGPAVGIYFPLDLAAGLPGKVTLTGQGERADLHATFTNLPWQPSAALGVVVGQIGAVPPGTYRIAVETSRGVVDAPVTVTESGAVVKLQYPAAR